MNYDLTLTFCVLLACVSYILDIMKINHIRGCMIMIKCKRELSILLLVNTENYY